MGHFHQAEARFEAVRLVAHKARPGFAARDQFAQVRHHLAAVTHAQRQGLRTMEEGFELVTHAAVEQDGLRPTFARAQHVAVGETAARHQRLEIFQTGTSGQQVAHVDVDSVKARAMEGSRHLNVGVNALLAQHGYFWTRACRNVRCSDIFVDIKGELHVQARILVIRFRVMLLIGTFRVITQALHLPGGFCPPHAQRGAAFAEHRVAVCFNDEAVTLNGFAQIVHAVCQTVLRQNRFNRVAIRRTYLNHRTQLFIEQRRQTVFAKRCNVRFNAAVASEGHLCQRHQQAAVGTVVVGQQLTLRHQRLDGVVEAFQLRDVAQLKGFYDAIQALVAERKLLAYHDRSDGGLLVTLAEMAFTGHCGVEANIATLGEDRLAALFNEELGAVIQVRAADRDAVEAILAKHGLADCVHYLGKAVQGDRFVIEADGHAVFSESRTTLRMWWAETTWQMQRLRDNPECADQEHNAKANDQDPGLNVKLSFDINEDIAAPYIATGARPKVAVLREQGVNSHVEMAAAFHRAGFDAIDVHMSDLLAGRTGLEDFQALVACGGFSYGDVLGAGEGWAKSILFNSRVRDEFETFFHRPQTLALGVCNGCQMMSNLRELIPGSEAWPRFVRNQSDRFEARFSLVEVTQSPSLLLQGMVGSQMPIAVSHGEGQVEVRDAAHLAQLESKGLVALRFVDNFGKVTETYPANPNGSANGITAVTSESGRATIMMPHPERVFRTVSNSWHPENWGEDSPWMRIFRNARKQLG